MSRPSRSGRPFVWAAKSMIVVVPPWAAAFEPLSKVSLANVPPTGSSMWVWTSMPPGTTYFPVASSVAPATGTAAGYEPSAGTTAPFVINVRIEPSSGLRGLHVAEGRNEAECYTAHEGAGRRRWDARTRGHLSLIH